MKLLIPIVSVVALIAGWFFISPLFIDEVVDEDFIGQLSSMSESERMAKKPEIMAAAANMPDKMNDESMPESGPTMLLQGQFIDADPVHKGSGDALVYQLASGELLLRMENFRVTNGPALVVYLAKHKSPTMASDVSDGGYLSLGKLKGNVGNQNYPIPTGTNIDDYGSVVIWCELFGVLFSPAALSSSAG